MISSRYIFFQNVSKVVVLFSIVFAITSCSRTQFIDLSTNMDRVDIKTDIEFVKQKLKQRHFDLNWENREQLIMGKLDSVVRDERIKSIADFDSALSKVLNKVDDGHTRVLSFDKKYRAEYVKKRKKANYVAMSLDSNTLYLRIPNFSDIAQLNNSISTFEKLNRQLSPERVIIDLRRNRGGSVRYVKKFLQHTIATEQSFCESIQIKKQKGSIGWLNSMGFKMRGFKSKGDLLVKPCSLLMKSGNNNFKYKYLVVDSSNISGAMVAAYHLKKDGFVVVGSDPSALFNSFGNATTFKMPNSNMYLVVSTLRVLVDENYSNRENDKLRCDIYSNEQSLNEILRIIKDYENK